MHDMWFHDIFIYIMVSWYLSQTHVPWSIDVYRSCIQNADFAIIKMKTIKKNISFGKKNLAVLHACRSYACERFIAFHLS